MELRSHRKYIHLNRKRLLINNEMMNHFTPDQLVDFVNTICMKCGVQRLIVVEMDLQ